MISPTVGRVVLVQRISKAQDESHHKLDITQPEPALVTYVHDDRKINVGGFTQDGRPFVANGITLLQDDDAKPEGKTFAYWMPYQKDQAAKAATVQPSNTGGPAASTSPTTAPAA